MAERRPLHRTTALVTGGAGFVGSWLCEELLARGARVVCVDSFVTGSRANVEPLLGRDDFQLVEADVSYGVPDVGPVDWVVHLASPASPEHYLRMPLETLRVGSQGTWNCLELAATHGARLLLASTSEVYGDPEVHPQPEDYWGNVNPVGPRSVYDEAKRFAEALVTTHRELGLVDTTIARIFNTYGPRMAAGDGRLVPTLVRQALGGEPLTVAGDGSRTRSLCWVGDTVDGLLRLLTSTEPGPVNIGNDAEHTLLDIAREVLAATGSEAPIVSVPVPRDDPRRRCPDLTQARTRLGWEPTTSLTEGLRRVVAAERELV